MSTFHVKQGDYHRRLLLQLSDLSTEGASSASARFRARDGGTVMAPSVAITSTNLVTVTFSAPQLDTAGVYLLEVVLTFPDGTETAPTSGYVTVIVEPKL